MESIKPPKIIKVYSLIRQNGMQFGTTSNISTSNMGCGFFPTLQEAEHHRTLEVLKDTNVPKYRFHIFELEVPNPAYSE